MSWLKKQPLGQRLLNIYILVTLFGCLLGALGCFIFLDDNYTETNVSWAYMWERQGLLFLCLSVFAALPVFLFLQSPEQKGWVRLFSGASLGLIVFLFLITKATTDLENENAAMVQVVDCHPALVDRWTSGSRSTSYHIALTSLAYDGQKNFSVSKRYYKLMGDVKAEGNLCIAKGALGWFVVVDAK